MSERRRLLFVCESGTDIRLVSGLSREFDLTLLVRPAFNGREISWPLTPEMVVRLIHGPPNRIAFAAYLAGWLVSNAQSVDAVLVQSTGAAAASANLIRRMIRLPTLLLVCSPTTAYFRCRQKELSVLGFWLGLAALEGTRRLNALLTQKYVTLSHYLAETVAKDGVDRSSVIPVYGVDTARFCPIPIVERAALRRKLGLPEEEYIVFFSSRVAPEKDTEVVLEAGRLLLAAGEKVLLLNLSGGHSDFMSRARKVGMERVVVARNAVHPQGELAPYYQSSDICIQASREEGLGFSPLEALACGIPVISSDVGGLRETIRHGITGLTIPVGDARAMADGIRYARAHPVEMQAMTARGREMVQKRFESSKAFEKLGDLVNSLVRSTASDRNR